MISISKVCSVGRKTALKKRQKCNFFRPESAMPVYKESPGYDRLQYWTRMALRRLYQAEGHSTKEAIKMSQALYEAIRNLNRKEVYSWSKARELEEPCGNANDLEKIAADYEYTQFRYADDVWREIESISMPDMRDRTHYEKLFNKRMRLSPEVKEVRKRFRSEERQRESKAQREKELAESRESFQPVLQQVLTRVLEQQRQEKDQGEDLFTLLLERIRSLRQQATC